MCRNLIIWCSFLLMAGFVPARAQATARFHGQVLHAGSGIPIEGASVLLERPPADGTPEHETRTDTFGFFSLPGIASGEYVLMAEHPRFIRKEQNLLVPAEGTNQVVRLQPIDAAEFFNLPFDIRCVSTHLALADAEVTLSYWRIGGNLAGAADQVRTLKTDWTGTLTFVGLSDGYYTMRVTRAGWEPVTYVPGPGMVTQGDKVRLSKEHFAMVYLKPIVQTMQVTVKGYDPVQEAANQPLKGMNVTLIGYDPINQLDILPPQSALTREDGSFNFQALPPITYKVQVQRLGYLPKEVLVQPNANAAFDPLTVEVQLEATKLKVTLASPYKTSQSVDQAAIRLLGIREANTEGINREGETAADAAGNTASVVFENLLPGRYWMHVAHSATIRDLPNRSGPLFGPSSFQVNFFPKETYAQVTVGTTEEVRIELEPVPATIRGRLWATDELANIESSFFDPEPNRVFHQIQQSGIIFQEHEVVSLLDPTNGVITVDSDAAGNYTARVIPGIFGVQIPTMVNYTGHNIEFGDLTSGTAPRNGPWPYPQIWPYPTWEGGHHGAGLRFDSAHEYQLDLFMHGHYINLCGRIQPEDEPFGDLVLSMSADGQKVQTVRYSHLADVGAEVVATGPATYRAQVKDNNYFILRGLQPGTYTIALDRTDYTHAPVSITIAPWQPPGVLPAIPPMSDGYFFPGITHCDVFFPAEWKTKGQIEVKLWDWIAGEDPHYSGGSPVAPRYFRMETLPDRLFRPFFSDGIPSGTWTIWRDHGDGWFTDSGAGSATFDAYDGGPRENTPPNASPGSVGYTMNLHARSAANPAMEIPGVTVEFQEMTRMAGGTVPGEGSPNPLSATYPGDLWKFAGADVRVTSAARREVLVDVFMTRQMQVTGLVMHASLPVPGAAVVVRNRYGTAIGQRVTGADGAFSVTVPPQPVYVDVNRRGFIPQRLRLDPKSPDEPDVAAIINLETVPSPVIDSFTMNRYGMFLPGVAKSGDSKGFDPERAQSRLTMTWKSQAHGANFSYALDGLVQGDEQKGPPESYTVEDKVVEMWLVDRRAFTNAFVNDLVQEVDDLVRPPAQLNYLTVHEWLRDIVAARKDGRPYYVIHQLQLRKHDGPESFEGQLKLWELPSGAFTPMVVAITESGGVAVKEFEPGENPVLQGMNLPKWVATMLEVISVGATIGEIEEMKGKIGHGEKYISVDLKVPKSEARIGLDPFTNNPAMDSALTYKFAVGVNLPIGQDGLPAGALAAGPRFLGFHVEEATAEMELNGKDKKLVLAVVLPAGDPPDPEEEDSAERPPIMIGPVELVQNEFELSGKFGIVQVLNTNWLGENTLAKYGFVLEAQGFYQLGLRANATLLTRVFPALNAVLQAANQVGLSFYALFEIAFGGKIAIEVLNEYPSLEGTVVRGAARESNFLGSTKAESEAKLILRLGIGAQVETRGKAVTGTLLLQVGAPSGVPDVDGVFFTVNKENDGYTFSKIEGAISAVARLAVNVWGIKYKKNWKWDAMSLLWEKPQAPGAAPISAFATAPGANFLLVPLDVTYTVINAASAPRENFIGRGGQIIEGFYEGGVADLIAGQRTALVFTGIDDQTGQMTVMVSMKNGGQWSAPVKVASSATVLAVAAAETADGRAMVVWSEIAEADIGNPFASSMLKYSLSSADGSSWSAPAVVTSSAETIYELKLASAGNQLLLSYLSTREGPMGENQSLFASTWNGTGWSAPAALVSEEPVASFETAGGASSNGLIVFQSGTNQLQSFFWDGATWGARLTVSTNFGNAAALAPASSNEWALVWQNQEGSLLLSTFQAASLQWSHGPVLLPAVHTEELALQPVQAEGETLYLVAWANAGEVSGISTAYFDRLGNVRMSPRMIATDRAGATFADLNIAPLDGFQASIIASYSTLTNVAIREYAAGLSTSTDCDGDGISDAAEIAGGTEADCNQNGIPDSCDLAAGISFDENGNGVPDECEPAPMDDCNRNGLSDKAEIALGIGDLDNDGLLDSCGAPLQVRSVPISTQTRQMFYRAHEIRVKSRTATALELEYDGVLEQAPDLLGPWAPTP